jgi:hypothetical protein
MVEANPLLRLLVDMRGMQGIDWGFREAFSSPAPLAPIPSSHYCGTEAPGSPILTTKDYGDFPHLARRPSAARELCRRIRL